MSFLIKSKILWIMLIITKLKFKREVLKSIYLFIIFFSCVCIKMSKKLSAKYYQENKEGMPKKFAKDIKIFLKNKKKKSGNILVNVRKISQRMKNKSFL